MLCREKVVHILVRFLPSHLYAHTFINNHLDWLQQSNKAHETIASKALPVLPILRGVNLKL